jgi:endoglycosylceramidase
LYSKQDIYDNVADTGDRFASIWRLIAQEFKDENGLLGYELMNEPWAGDVVADLSLALPGVAGRENLEPLYQKVIYT